MEITRLRCQHVRLPWGRGRYHRVRCHKTWQTSKKNHVSVRRPHYLSIHGAQLKLGKPETREGFLSDCV